MRRTAQYRDQAMVNGARNREEHVRGRQTSSRGRQGRHPGTSGHQALLSIYDRWPKGRVQRDRLPPPPRSQHRSSAPRRRDARLLRRDGPDHSLWKPMPAGQEPHRDPKLNGYAPPNAVDRAEGAAARDQGPHEGMHEPRVVSPSRLQARREGPEADDAGSPVRSFATEGRVRPREYNSSSATVVDEVSLTPKER